MIRKFLVLTLISGCLPLLEGEHPDFSISKGEKTEWISLFNGYDFEGWRGVNRENFPEKGWKIENGAIVCTGENGGSIVTIEKYGQFDLKWEWKLMDKGANSGIKYYVNERDGDEGSTYGYGIEYQMIDDVDWVGSGRMQPNDYHTTGAAYELYPPSFKKKVKPIGKWNRSEIISREGKVEHWLNGKKILEYDRKSQDFKDRIAKSKFSKVKGYGLFEDGHILLQDHESVTYFRNIRIKLLE
ncbi:MAG: 3-keto-disaccharide hydrolase [Phocaeicola sp.]|uniref:3-keto-disaccharide hydrolase n=1 Tax=Phocaeicola sp. TaxID=2773926 RepID=UPI003FA10EE5